MFFRKYGWKKDRHDDRDFQFRPRLLHVAAPPPASSNPEVIPVYDQGKLGTCTANGWSYMYDYEGSAQGFPLMTPSRLKFYFDERLQSGGDTNEDSGAEIRDGAKAIAKYGMCPETMWPYDETQFTVKPPQTCYDCGFKHLGLAYARVPQNNLAIMATLASGKPIVFGFNVYESFEGDQIANTGIMSLPASNEEECGGHCVVATNYNRFFKMPSGDTQAMVRCRNSWGGSWGDKGHFWMPMSFFLDPAMSSDFWVLTKVC